MMRVVFICICLLPMTLGLRLASFFQDGMVLQRGPEWAIIYGFDALDPQNVKADLSCYLYGTDLGILSFRSSFSYAFMESNHQDTGYWEVRILIPAAGTTCDITFYEESTPTQKLSLAVIFGDVWLCSGQSNMVYQMKQIENSIEEIENSTRYSNIRYTAMELVTSDQEEADIKTRIPWSDPSNSKNLGMMSAVCFLFARNIQDMMMLRGETVPMGMIESAWGGTRIEAWSNKAALDSCGVEDLVIENKPQNSNSYLWNAMIAPLRRMSLTGFLWYQGEANANWQRELYNCTFPALIDSWRQEFSNEEAPFGFVQLSTIEYGASSLTYPQIRAHQTADQHTVPNNKMPGTFMAVAVDTYDKDHGIHPKYKQIVGKRLAIAGMSVAYSMDDFPSQGPVATSPRILVSGNIRLTYDQNITYDDSELTGFFYCCGHPDVCKDSTYDSDWPLIEKEEVVFHPQIMSLDIMPRQCGEDISFSLAYLWRQTPIETPVWGAPIYAADNFLLPSPPWLWSDVQ